MELLERLGVRDRSHHRPAELSGGEQQRVAIARAMMNAPAMILADEPTGTLDEQNGREIMTLLGELRRDAGTTIIMVTHNHEWADFAQTTYELCDGVLHAPAVA